MGAAFQRVEGFEEGFVQSSSGLDARLLAAFENDPSMILLADTVLGSASPIPPMFGPRMAPTAIAPERESHDSSMRSKLSEKTPLPATFFASAESVPADLRHLSSALRGDSHLVDSNSSTVAFPAFCNELSRSCYPNITEPSPQDNRFVTSPSIDRNSPPIVLILCRFTLIAATQRRLMKGNYIPKYPSPYRIRGNHDTH